MSFFEIPDWAHESSHSFERQMSFTASEMVFPLERAHRRGEDVLPAFRVDFRFGGGELVPSTSARIDTSASSESAWDVFIGTGKIWDESAEDEWSRAAFPLQLTDPIVGSLRNCVATFAFNVAEISKSRVQCSQEAADLNDLQIGDITASVATSFAPVSRAIPEPEAPPLIPVRPLSEIDLDGAVARHFDRPHSTSAATSIGAIYLDGVLYVHPPRTRHGNYPYPDSMRHGVYSISKSLTGSLAMFCLAERYGDQIFDEKIVDFVPQFSDRQEWADFTFGHALNMATGTRGGEQLDLLFNPHMMAESKSAAIDNIAGLGDASPAPGEEFNYAGTNFFVLSYVLQNYVKAREGDGVQYWDLVTDDFLASIGAATLDVIFTQGPVDDERIPVLGYGARPTLDKAAKIALLIANEGVFDGQQILNRGAVAEALGRTSWRGLEMRSRPDRHRHGFWTLSIDTGECGIAVPYMEGHGSNHILFLRSVAIIFRFMDEFDRDIETLVRAAEQVRSSCS